jgi:hypothetical protein
LNIKEAQNIASNANVAISTLALHRTVMTEACPLKTRFYLAMGLPVILGYDDTDLMEKQPDFLLNIGNYPSNVKDNMSLIRSFIISKRRHRTSIYNYADENLCNFKKEKERIDFFERVLARS